MPKPPSIHYEIGSRGCGGAGVPRRVWHDRSPGPHCSRSGRFRTAELAHSEGPPMPGVELRFVGADGDRGCPRGSRRSPTREGSPGDAGLCGPGSRRRRTSDDTGFLRTGDLGRLDPGGNIIVTGRLKDVIIRKGENVSAKELEDPLFTHPAIRDVSVVGLPDAARGELACAVDRVRRRFPRCGDGRRVPDPVWPDAAEASRTSGARRFVAAQRWARSTRELRQRFGRDNPLPFDAPERRIMVR